MCAKSARKCTLILVPKGNNNFENLSYSLDEIKTDNNWHIFSWFFLGGKCVSAAVVHNEINIFYVKLHNSGIL